jgi:hypothetical protein
MWQMDFKSPLGWDAPVWPLSMVDDDSRYEIDLHATWSTQAEALEQRMVGAFERCGMPEEMLRDYRTPGGTRKR